MYLYALTMLFPLRDFLCLKSFATSNCGFQLGESSKNSQREKTIIAFALAGDTGRESSPDPTKLIRSCAPAASPKVSPAKANSPSPAKAPKDWSKYEVGPDDRLPEVLSQAEAIHNTGIFSMSTILNESVLAMSCLSPCV